MCCFVVVVKMPQLFGKSDHKSMFVFACKGEGDRQIDGKILDKPSVFNLVIIMMARSFFHSLLVGDTIQHESPIVHTAGSEHIQTTLPHEW